jgi:hypothetical protein
VRAQHVWRDQRIGEVDGSLRRDASYKELDQANGSCIALEQVPMAVDHDGRIRFLLG